METSEKESFLTLSRDTEKLNVVMIWVRLHKLVIKFASICNKLTDTESGPKATQPAFTCSKLTIETLEQNVKYVQS